jgi:hypothetical protein
VVWFFRVLESADGQWLCRRGMEEIDRHPHMGEALRHIEEVAASALPARVFLHRLDGSVDAVADLPAAAD